MEISVFFDSKYCPPFRPRPSDLLFSGVRLVQDRTGHVLEGKKKIEANFCGVKVCQQV